ncbi:MAG: hypothetical protein ACOYXY_05995 [Thermodesulfobacteriota bacterium]
MSKLVEKAPREPQPRIIYNLPDENIYPKFFCDGQYFHEMNWKDWDAVVEGFRSRVRDWYFTPLEPIKENSGYVVMCAMCAIIDLLTQYEYGLNWHNPRKYKHFLREKIPAFGKKLSRPVQVSVSRGDGWEKRKLKDFADCFYTGVRCSLHHHGDLAPYTGISDVKLIHEFPDAGTSQCGKYQYPIVVVNPRDLFEKIKKIVNDYCDDLKRDPKSERAKRFRTKFAEDFGITIG